MAQLKSGSTVNGGTVAVLSASQSWSGTQTFTNATVSGTLTATASSAKYADLAEKYLADKHYEPGTVLAFGGVNEVTETRFEADTRIAGVVSTDPAYTMNADLNDINAATVALIGRVPCRVIGQVSKGDMLVSSALPGVAMAWSDETADPRLGAIIGKSLEDKASNELGVIEVVIGAR